MKEIEFTTKGRIKKRQRTPHEFRDVLLSLARFASIQRESNASPL